MTLAVSLRDGNVVQADQVEAEESEHLRLSKVDGALEARNLSQDWQTFAT